MKNRNAVVVPLLVVMSLMFIWNLSRNINDILIPHLKRACQLTDFQSSLIQSAFFGGYFLLALPVGKCINKYGYKVGMATGLYMHRETIHSSIRQLIPIGKVWNWAQHRLRVTTSAFPVELTQPGTLFPDSILIKKVSQQIPGLKGTTFAQTLFSRRADSNLQNR